MLQIFLQIEADLWQQIFQHFPTQLSLGVGYGWVGFPKMTWCRLARERPQYVQQPINLTCPQSSQTVINRLSNISLSNAVCGTVRQMARRVVF